MSGILSYGNNVRSAVLFCLLLCINFSGSAQQDSVQFQKKLDSLMVLIPGSPDSTKARIYIMVSQDYQAIDRAKSFKYAKAALALSEKGNDRSKVAICLNYLGDLYWFSGDYATASDYYYKALSIYEALKDKEGIADCYRNIGWIYQGQELYKQTLEYYFKSLAINQELNLPKKIIANYDDLGIVYKYMGNYEEALKYCNKTIQLSKETNSTKGLATGHGNIAALYVSMGQYDLAIENFLSSSKFHESINDHYNSAEGYIGMSECYYQLKNYHKSIEYAEKAAVISKKFDYKNTATSAYRMLAEAYSMQNDHAKAFKYMHLFSDLRDSTYNAQNSKQINEMAAKYESDKKELMIDSFEKDKKLSDEKSAQDKKFRIFMILFSLIIAGFSVVLFKGNLQKKKANNSLSLAYKEIEVQNKDITDSINYAKQIQRARLPNPSIILNHLPDAFGLYKPKDVVSGDFYWFAEHENGKLMLASADCTGHGIPGAFMSLIGIDELNHASLEKRIDNASHILSSVNKGVKKALRQNEKNSMSRDGMDIALCIFDLKKNTLEYAGANRPLYYIRNRKLHEIIPTKAAIGGTTDNDQEFKNHIIDLQKNDMIYVFTDGFADQFGGPEGKKFMTKRFKDLLLSIHDKPVAEQEAFLENTLENWKKDISQVDDILVMGIRI